MIKRQALDVRVAHVTEESHLRCGHDDSTVRLILHEPCHSIDTHAGDNIQMRGKFAMTFKLRRLLICVFLFGVFTDGLAQHLDPQAGSSEPVRAAAARRVIALQGQTNFRDLGGYETADGRHVRWGMIFRSGELSHLTGADYREISTLGIHTVYDLRDQSERASQPTNWGANPVRAFASAKTGTISGTMSRLSDPTIDAASAQAALADFYAQMPDLYAPEYRVIVHELLDGRAPLLLHCTAGKDRSGVASALILTALGVPRATVVQDYVLTDQLLKPSSEPPKTEFMRRFQNLPAEVQHAMMSADQAYIAAAFRSMESRHGSVGKYLSTELGVGPNQIKRLRSLYVE
jgi:protein-tyrosine phosphatase